MSPVFHFEDLFLESFPAAVRTADKNVREKLHFHLFKSVPAARLAPTAGYIKRKMAGIEARRPGRRRAGKQTADRIHGLGVGQGVGPWRAADGPLVHQFYIHQLFETLNGFVTAGTTLRVPLDPFNPLVKNLFRQGGFARSRHAGQTDKQP